MANQSTEASPKSGLNAWLGKKVGQGAIAPTSTEGAVLALDLDRIDDNPWQNRSGMDERKLEELAASIASTGLLQAITVRKAGDRYQVIAGHRRVRAYKLLRDGATTDEERKRYATIKAQEHLGVSDADMMLFVLVENVQREDPDDVDLAVGFANLQKSGATAESPDGLTTAQLAEKTGVDQTRVKRLLQLHRAPDVVKAACSTGLMIPLLGDDGQPLTTPSGRPKQEHRKLELLAALEVARYYAQLAKAVSPSEAVDRTEKLTARALHENWGFRKLAAEVAKRIEALKSKASEGEGAAAPESEPSEAGPKARPALFSENEKQFTIHKGRLAGMTAEERGALLQRVTALLAEAPAAGGPQVKA